MIDDYIRMYNVLKESGLKYVVVMLLYIGEWGWEFSSGGVISLFFSFFGEFF